MTGITWIASYPKSGNTWLRLLFANLFLNADRPASINEIRKFCATESSRTYLERVAGGPLGDATVDQLLPLRFQLHRALARNRAHYVLCKTHWPFTDRHARRAFDPDCTRNAIYIVRDPRDVVVSFAHHNASSYEETIRLVNAPDATSRGGRRLVREYYGSWSNHVRSWREQSDVPVCVVRYEDLAADPEATFARIVAFLGFPADTARIRKAVRFADLDVARAQEAREGFDEAPGTGSRFFREGRVGAGRDQLTGEQCAEIARVHGPAMRAFGYLEDAPAAPE